MIVMEEVRLKSEATDYTGQEFGRLTVIRPDRRIGRKRMWLCLCDCGVEKLIRQDHLRTGRIVSCGCFKAENSSQVNSTHRMSHTKEHNAWLAMKSRCYDPGNPNYDRYEGRGIKVADEWLNDFEAFYTHIGPAPRL